MPLTTAVPLPVSALVEMPLTFQKDPSEQYQADPLPSTPSSWRSWGVLRTVRRAAWSPMTRRRLTPTGPSWPSTGRARLDASRRDEAALVLRDLGSLDEVPRPFAAVRAERPAWPTAPLAPDPARGGYPPVYDPDPRSRPPAPTDAPERLVPAAAAGSDSDAPVYHVFAARPEVPPATLATRSIAATRFRLALTGLANQPGTKPVALAPARRALGDGDCDHRAADRARRWRPDGLDQSRGRPLPGRRSHGQGCDEVADLPDPGAVPHARRDPLPARPGQR